MTREPAESPRLSETAAPEDRLLIELQAWLAGLPARQPAAWTQLPDIGLYMDQVLTYVDRQLSLYRSSEKEHVLTPAMINNYIKDSLLPRAEMKKYAPSHLASLTMIGALKQVLSIQDLQILLGGSRDGQLVLETYERFLYGQKAVLGETAAQIQGQLEHLANRPSDFAAAGMSTADSGLDMASSSQNAATVGPDTTTAGLRRLALDLAIEARVRILVAEQLLATVVEAEKIAQAKKLASDTDEKLNRKKTRQSGKPD